MGLFYMARTFRRKTGRKTRSNKKSTRRTRRKGGGILYFLTLAAMLARANANFGPVKHYVELELTDGRLIPGEINSYDPTVKNPDVFISTEYVKYFDPQNVRNSEKRGHYVKPTCENGVAGVTLSTNGGVEEQNRGRYEPTYKVVNTCSNK